MTWDRNAEFILTGSFDRCVGLWELKTGRGTSFAATGHNGPVHSVEWTDEDAFAITCSEDRVRVLDGYCLHTGWTEEMEDEINKVSGFVAASCSRRTTFLLGILAENGARLVLASLPSAAVLDGIRMIQPAGCLAWSPAEELLAVGTGESILVFHATQAGFDGSPRELTSNAPQVYALAFSGDGTVLASHDAQGLKIWDARSGRCIADLDENLKILSKRRPRSGIAFHPTRPLLAMVTPNGCAVRIMEIHCET